MGLLPLPVKLSVDSNRRILFETPLPENGGIAYYLDSELHVVECRFSDNFPFLHERLYLQHLLDHALSPLESAALGRPAFFPAAPDGNSPALEQLWQ